MRREARERRVYATLRVTRRTIAVVAGLAMLGGVATVTSVASASNDPAAQFIGTGNECAVETSALEAHVEEEPDGFRHVHYRGKGKHKHKHHKHKGGGNAGGGEEVVDDPAECTDGDGTTGGNVGGNVPDGDGGNDGGGDGTTDGDNGDNPGGENPDGGDTPDGENPDGEQPDGDNPDGEQPVDEVPEDPDDPLAGQILGTDCSISNLEVHNGLQEGPRCVNIEMGEVGAANQNPTLLITNAPNEVRADEGFTIQVSTRNLVRDRFLPAGQAGYYRESAYLTPEGLTRGHFHLGCRILVDPNSAEQPDLDPAFFVAIEDSQGGAEPDFVNVEIPPLEQPGLYRCMAWAGDPTHRVPMMQFARHFVAVDVVRINVT